MSRNLRRSRRAPKPKLSSDFKVGDVVEIHRNGSNVKATLAQLLTEGSSANPRWLVNFPTPPYKEEVYEHTFWVKLGDKPIDDAVAGPVDHAKAEDSASSTSKGSASQEKPLPSSVSKSGLNGPSDKKKPTSDSAAAAGLESEGSNGKKKAVSFSDESSSNTSGKRTGRRGKAGKDSKSVRDAKMSAREARSRRRQALMDEPSASSAAPPAGTTSAAGGKRKVSGAAAMAAQNKRKRMEAANNKQSSTEEEESVTKVKFLTGTLYLYREGNRRRAEFVRRV
mmetsp:Transcript_11125/g.24791  ORF Transcript_11125/g.24791 Transcript_11125/m.24791 type:complete len:281 (+) Transcript_11125:109-951(+)|eukprot:CAMPEP_0168738526 /NCGR_PEP_ID=MMETSP0724-20121128/10981_1 /TAXON_ID=265536 /ORGANISM="Amphiprora sp., Strain CCMP467" /LENGTH=280 /DNA_ID=CAMNT_0008785877 /DNA_START=112 /DNA_END=954 /DNA_ORIENTATION=+